MARQRVTREQAAEIIRLCMEGVMCDDAIAARYQMSKTNVRLIRSKRVWHSLWQELQVG